MRRGVSMKILIIPSWYPNPDDREQCIFVREQAMALQRIGHSVSVLSVQMKVGLKASCQKVVYSEQKDGINILYKDVCVIAPSKLIHLTEYLYYNALDNLYNIFVDQYSKPDIIYGHFSYPAGCGAVKLGKKHNIPVVVEEHYSYLMNRKISFSMRKVLAETVNGANAFIAVSQKLKESIVRHIECEEDKILVVSNMINPCFRYHESKSSNLFTFLAIGSLIERKGFVELLNAFVKIYSDNPRVRLRIGGIGPLENQIKEIAKEKKIEDAVTLLGQLSREDTLREYVRCDCFVLPSKAETFGLVYREALAVGRPIITTNHGGFTKKDWHDEYGFMVAIGNENQLLHSMKKMINKRNTFHDMTISKICLESCSEIAVIKEIEEILENTIK